MESRLSVATAAPASYKALYAVTGTIRSSSLPVRLQHLIDLRVSQINGCAFCIDMHDKEARHAGESDERIADLAGWERSDRFDPAERAAFAWAETLTRSLHDRIDDAHRDLQRHFDTNQIGALTMAVAAINAWNRVGIAQHIAQDIVAHEAA